MGVDKEAKLNRWIFLSLSLFRYTCISRSCRKRKSHTSTRLARNTVFGSCSISYRRTIMRCATVRRSPKTKRKSCGYSRPSESAKLLVAAPFANYPLPIRCPPPAIRFVFNHQTVIFAVVLFPFFMTKEEIKKWIYIYIKRDLLFSFFFFYIWDKHLIFGIWNDTVHGTDGRR